MTGWQIQLLATLVKILGVVAVLNATVAVMTWAERRFSAWMQDRLGPNRVGPFGLLQPLADGMKFLLKEDIVPAHVHKPLFILAPALSLVPALLAFSVVPFGGTLTIAGHEIPLVIADIDVGVLFVLAVTAMGVYGIVMAGWASNNKYSLMGGLRSSAQLISYELAMGLAILGVLMGAGTFRLRSIVELQDGWAWNVFLQPAGFIVFLVAAFAETNRLPFDLPEAESELVAGYHTEYSSMKFAMFFMSEYVNMTTAACLMVVLFFGGWHLPGLDRLLSGNTLALAGAVVFAAKVAFFLFFFIWVRWTLPRFRYDQLMRVGWKVLLPVAFANVAWVSVLVGSGVYDRMQSPGQSAALSPGGSPALAPAPASSTRALPAGVDEAAEGRP